MEGAQRIWNTYVHATTKIIEKASRFCKGKGLRFKRKTRMNGHTGKMIWWFVVHRDESTLDELDSKWEHLHTQASWVLQPCTKPAHEEDNTATISINTELQSTPRDVTVANSDNTSSATPPQDNLEGATPSSNHQAADHNAHFFRCYSSGASKSIYLASTPALILL